MTDVKALAYVNMFGVLGALEDQCVLDEKAAEILSKLKHPIALCFSVKNGPCATFHFSKDGCRMTEGSAGATCRMNFAAPEKFNALIDDSKPGFPVKRPLQVLSFLLGPFTKLTDRLTEILRPSEKAMKDPAFFDLSTKLTMFTVAGAISALANHDPISRISAGNTVDGEISLGIKDDVHVTVSMKDGKFKTVKEKSRHPRAVMEFATIDLANRLFNGTASSINELCSGNIYLSGMISMVDNVNRILDRVAVYLA